MNNLTDSGKKYLGILSTYAIIVSGIMTYSKRAFVPNKNELQGCLFFH
ncbi:hypothetical protein J2S01_000441 [Pectinatus haikarae]|uniref:Uncharacterized protein n=1 Tax=Pectinatus haikarae TaxID=349096 RepID=A0ABT9Y4I5_9FIRM|nr:hypothetical protein [Pectinatus haikarae]